MKKAIITLVTLVTTYTVGQLIETEEKKRGTDLSIIYAECTTAGLVIGAIGRKIIKSI